MITPLFPHPAALVTSQKLTAMVIADLHIGWELALAQDGIHVPTQTPKLLKKLINLVAIYRPEKLVVLGDVKHTVARAETGEWRDVPEFFTELRKHVDEICIIRGNHDGNLEPLLPETVKFLPATGISLGDVGLFHGHQWLSSDLLRCRTLVMGHVHPVVAFRDPAGFRITRQVWVMLSCNRAKLTENLMRRHKMPTEPKKSRRVESVPRQPVMQLFIMPSFNDFLGGRPLNTGRHENIEPERIVGPVLRSDAVNIDNAETYLLDGTYLGALSQLRNMS